jgi:cold shock CspA family protein
MPPCYGVVKWFSEVKGCGILGSENGVDVFVHRLAIRPGEKVLRKGEHVSFNLLKSPRGLLANQVSRLSKRRPSTVENSSGAYALCHRFAD